MGCEKVYGIIEPGMLIPVMKYDAAWKKNSAGCH